MTSTPDSQAVTLVTGASGFVGRAVCTLLAARKCAVRGVVRKLSSSNIEYPVYIQPGGISPSTDWSEPLADVNQVIHLAARVHIMHDTAADPLAEFRAINVDGTLNLARQAAAAGVKRFIFLSTIKVNGEISDSPYTESDSPMPQNAYATSKMEAELGLRDIASNLGMEVVILRSPLVYGPSVGANFLSLLRAVDLGLPMPFGLIDNRRSLIYLGNLVDAVTACMTHPDAAGKTYLVSDGEDISTPELIRQLARALDCSPRLLPIPSGLMKLAGRLLSKKQEVDRLLGSLTIDSSAIRHDLDWIPPFSMQEGLLTTANWYRQKKSLC